MVTILRVEGPKAPSPWHRPGYGSNQQGALKGKKAWLLENVNLPYSYMLKMENNSFCVFRR